MESAEQVVTLIDFDTEHGQWTASCGDPDCPNTGEFARSDGGSPEEHDMIWLTGVRHEEHFHGGDGKLDCDALISVRPYPVPAVIRG